MLKDNQWQDESCIIVLGGPSLRDFDWSLLKGRPEKIIVVNRAYRDVQHADAFFTEDLSFIEEFSKKPDWKTFQGVKVFHTLGPDLLERARKADPNLFIIEKKRRDKFWSKSIADGLSQSSNSAIGAANLADILGCTRIYWLGLDCNPASGLMPHYHDDYADNYQLHAPAQMLVDFASDFEHWVAPHLKHLKVFNLNLGSAVTAWPRWDRDSFFKIGMPSTISVNFTRQVEMRFDFKEDSCASS